MTTFTVREKNIIVMKIRGMSFDEIADHYHCSPLRIRNIYIKIKRKRMRIEQHADLVELAKIDLDKQGRKDMESFIKRQEIKDRME